MDDADWSRLQAVLAKSNVDDPKNLALRTLWLHDQIADVKSEADCARYYQLAEELREKARAAGIDTRSIEWLHSADGILATTYGAKCLDWEDGIAGAKWL